MKISCTAFVLLIRTLHSLASDDSPFQLTNKAAGFCLVKTNNFCNDIRWTTGDRLLVLQRKKCLGVEGKSVGSSITLYDCDETSELQKWECRNETVLALKGQELYVELTADNMAVLSNTIGPNNHLTISGTQSGACTRTYRELYAIDGNAAGMPCMFPFLYKDQWYTDCTTFDSSEKRLWCAVETKYQSERWGYCPISTKESWYKHPTTGAYYQLNTLSSLTWPEADTSCKQQGASLLSITDPHEQAYVIALLGPGANKLWTGLVLNPEHGWKWSDGRPYRYMKWDSGHPLPNPGHNCAIIDPAVQYFWQSSLCTKKLGYICHSNPGEELPTQAVETGFCSAPWIPYNGHCFHINRTQKTWPDAQRDCRSKGGDLVSIRNLEDQSFVISQLGYESTDELWIGLNDRKTEGLFDWIDHSTVSFTSWEFGKPGVSTDIKDCVLIRGENGNWDDRVCEERHGSICMKMSASRPIGYGEERNVGCKTGWRRHGSYCYFIGAQAKTFDEAKDDCKSSDSYLADVSNGVDNAFLVSLVGTRPEKHFWLGLSNQKHILQFVWTNRDDVTFTHWNANMPGRQRGCVAMATGIFAGLWDVLPCASTEKYICKRLAEGAHLTPPPTTVQTAHCPEDWVHIGSRDFCIKLFVYEQKTWYEARDYCRAIGGDLLSIHSADDLRELPHRYGKFWIGLSAPDPATGYVWSDGSPLQFQHWMDGEPNNKNNVESCAEFETSLRLRRGSWRDVQCETLNQWFCQIPGGATPKPPPSITTPLYNTTSDGWRQWNGNQYVVAKFPRAMEEARRECKRRHGDLVTINSEAERVFVWQMIQKRNEYYWIGLAAGLDGTHSWMDGSPVAFQSWDENQPRFLNNDETCVVMTTSMGFWHNFNCGFEHNYICKRSRSPHPGATIAPTVRPQGGCPQNWRKFDSKCYNIINNQRETWDGARTQCKAMGGNLATILTRRVQVFLMTVMAEAPTTDLWIGLHRQNSQRFYWTDGQAKRYENWPGNYYGYHSHMKNELEACIMLTTDSTIGVGKWTKKTCSDTAGYICHKNLDHSLPDSPEPTASHYVKIANDSIKLVTERMTWYEAKRHCEGDGAKLASLRNEWSQIYTELLTSTVGAPLWIGLNKKETGGYYKFIDGWHLSVTYWGRQEPRNQPCVYVDSSGKWVTASCTDKMQSICMKSTDVPPPTSNSSEFPGRCPEDPNKFMNQRQTLSWLPFRQYCYLFIPFQKTWPESSADCARYDATQASIEDPAEQEYILSNINVYQDRQMSFWIGLYSNQRGTWRWLDKTIMDYSNWDDGEPGDDMSYGEIRAKTGKWRAVTPGYNRGYICKTPKVLEQVPPTAANPVVDQTHSNGILVVALVVSAIAIGTVIALLLYMRSGRRCITGNYLLQQ